MLYRLGRFSARRPWTVIGAWLVVSVLVIGAAGAVGRELEDSFEVPGVDSQRATELLERAGSDQAGLTAQLVLTPRAARFDSPAAREALARVRERVAALPNVLGTSAPAVSESGRVARIEVRYPVLADVTAADLARLKAFGAAANEDSVLRLEMGGELFFAFEESSPGELIGVLAAALILFVAFGSLVAMGLPIGIALFGLVVGIGAMSLVAYVVDIPSWAPQLGSMVGLGVGIDYALFLVTRHRRTSRSGSSSRSRSPGRWRPPDRSSSSRARRSSSRSSAWPSRGSRS